MQKEYLFIYGTLLLQDNAFGQYLRQRCSFHSKGNIRGRLYDIGDYPGFIPDPDAGYVHGSIYQLNSPVVLPQMDAYEGYGDNEDQPNLYIRTNQIIETDIGDIEAWVYEYNLTVDGLTQITSGDYIEYLSKKIPRLVSPGEIQL